MDAIHYNTFNAVNALFIVSESKHKSVNLTSK